MPSRCRLRDVQTQEAGILPAEVRTGLIPVLHREAAMTRWTEGEKGPSRRPKRPAEGPRPDGLRFSRGAVAQVFGRRPISEVDLACSSLLSKGGRGRRRVAAAPPPFSSVQHVSGSSISSVAFHLGLRRPGGMCRANRAGKDRHFPAPGHRDQRAQRTWARYRCASRPPWIAIPDPTVKTADVPPATGTAGLGARGTATADGSPTASPEPSSKHTRRSRSNTWPALARRRCQQCGLSVNP